MNDKKLREALSEVLEIEAEYFDFEDLTNSQKEEIVKKIIKVVREKEEGKSDDSQKIKN